MLASQTPTIVCVGAADAATTGQLTRLAAAAGGKIQLAMLDVKLYPQVAQQLGVRMTPTLLLVAQGLRCQLHDQLSAVGLTGLPELPPKKLIGNMAAEFVEQRRLGLERYLQEICTIAGASGPDGGTKAALKSLYTFVGADWLLDEEAQDTLDGWVRQPLTS